MDTFFSTLDMTTLVRTILYAHVVDAPILPNPLSVSNSTTVSIFFF